MMHTMKSVWTFAFAALFLLFMTGCATQPAPQPLSSPVKLVPEPGKAMLIGEGAAGNGDPVIYITNVDGTPVPGGERSALMPITLAPGPHKIVIALSAGDLFSALMFDFTAQEGRVYRARAQQKRDLPWYSMPLTSVGGQTYFWVEDNASGEAVTEKKLKLVTSQQQPIFIPIPVR